MPNRLPPITVTVTPTTLATPEDIPESDGLVLDMYDATADVQVGSLWGTEFSMSRDELPNDLAFVVAALPAGTRSVVFSLSGPISSEQVENFPPYTSFGNWGPNYYGRQLPVGDYQILIEIYSGWSGSGERLEEEILAFSILD